MPLIILQMSYQEVNILSARDSKEILDATIIEGECYKGDLTTHMLAVEGLSPEYKFTIDRVNVYLSLPYFIEQGRLGVVGFVEKDGNIFARSFYRSNSQGVWRYLPYYGLDGGEISNYGKGFSEDSITLPLQAQNILAQISYGRMAHPYNPDLISVGTIYAASSYESDLIERYWTGHPDFKKWDAQRWIEARKSPYQLEVSYEPVKLKGNFYTNDVRGYQKHVPEEVVFNNPDQSPDFSKLLMEFNQNSSLYGRIFTEVFPSRDKQFLFGFCRDRLNRVWVGQIDTNSEIGSTGLRKLWVDGGELTTPAYEYGESGDEDPTGGYGNKALMNGRYEDMFENYLSRIPVIKEYLASR